MNNLKFKYFSAQNFICFGPEGIEIDLSKMGNIVLIRGENLDVLDEDEKEGEERIASNGTGKSTIPDIVIWALFGKPIKNHKKVHNEHVINNRVGKDCRTEVRWDNYRVVRTRTKSGKSNTGTLRMWESSNGVWDKTTEITKGGMSDTQDLITEKLGLNYETCLNLLVFADQSLYTFLECEGPDKRMIVEDLMGLQIFRAYSDEAKEKKKDLKDKIKLQRTEYEHSLIELKAAKERIDKIHTEETNWKTKCEFDLKALNLQLYRLQETVKNSDIGPALAKYDEAQAKITEYSNSIQITDEQIAQTRTKLQLCQEKIESRKQERDQLTQQIFKLQSQNASSQQTIANESKTLKVKDKAGQRCNSCYGIVSEENYETFVASAEKIIEENQAIINANNILISELNVQLGQAKDRIIKGNQMTAKLQLEESQKTQAIDEYRKEIRRLSAIEKPTANEQEKELLIKIAEMEKQIDGKKEQMNGPSPYVSLLATAIKDADTKEAESKAKQVELDTIEADLPYLEWWTDGFSPKGIPKFAINDIVPTLNSQVAHWLEFLINGKIKLSFNNELDETIERNPSDGDPFVYHAMSGGERRRLNLAISQAFAYIQSHSSKAMPSIVFLDEVTTNIDPMGVVGVYNMILELAKDKQVFVTTHDQGLLELLQGCETLYLRKKGGFTKLVNNI